MDQELDEWVEEMKKDPALTELVLPEQSESSEWEIPVCTKHACIHTYMNKHSEIVKCKTCA